MYIGWVICSCRGKSCRREVLANRLDQLPSGEGFGEVGGRTRLAGSITGVRPVLGGDKDDRCRRPPAARCR